jgi:ribonuclease P protein component
MFSASKKKFKHAVDRNRAKRLMRESYRKQKIKLYEALVAQQQQMALSWVYKHKELLDYTQVYQEMEGTMERLLRHLSQK